MGLDNDKSKLPLGEYITAWVLVSIAGIFMVMAVSSCGGV